MVRFLKPSIEWLHVQRILLLEVDSDSSNLSVEAVDPLFAIIEASLWEVLSGAVLVIVGLQSASSPPIDVIDEVVVHVSSLLLNVVV